MTSYWLNNHKLTFIMYANCKLLGDVILSAKRNALHTTTFDECSLECMDGMKNAHYKRGPDIYLYDNWIEEA